MVVRTQGPSENRATNGNMPLVKISAYCHSAHNLEHVFVRLSKSSPDVVGIQHTQGAHHLAETRCSLCVCMSVYSLCVSVLFGGGGWGKSSTCQGGGYAKRVALAFSEQHGVPSGGHCWRLQAFGTDGCSKVDATAGA